MRSMPLLGEALGHQVECLGASCGSHMATRQQKGESVRMHETCTFKISHFSLSRKPDVGASSSEKLDTHKAGSNVKSQLYDANATTQHTTTLENSAHCNGLRHMTSDRLMNSRS